MRHRRTTWFRRHLPFVALVGMTCLLMLGTFIDWLAN